MIRCFQPGQLFQADQRHIGASAALDDERFSGFCDSVAMALEMGSEIGIVGHSRHLVIVQHLVLNGGSVLTPGRGLPTSKRPG